MLSSALRACYYVPDAGHDHILAASACIFVVISRFILVTIFVREGARVISIVFLSTLLFITEEIVQK